MPLMEALQAEELLETCRTRWQYGEWSALTQLSLEEISRDRSRAKVAVLVAAAHGQLGDTAASRRFAAAALDWGCSREVVARVLTASIHNSLARVATSLQEDEDARTHFEDSVRLVEPRADIRLVSQTRRVRETARLGFLPEAAAAIEEQLEVVREAPADHGHRLTILSSDISLLKHELTIALRRGQIYSGSAEDATAPERLEHRAVSQLGQDLWVLERSGHKRGGFFVEFGATDGVTLSNTWLLERDFGWTGLCAEPNPELFALLQKNRSCAVSMACLAGRSGQQVEFILADAFGGIADYAEADSHANRRAAYRAEGHVLTLETVSLADFLEGHGAPAEIDYLSIDTEGNEYDILCTFPFDRWKIRLITVEHNFTPARDRIRQLLEPLGYHRTERQFDDWYELTER